MTNEQILKQVIEKARDNGYLKELDYKPFISVIKNNIRIGDGRTTCNDYCINDIIFSHSFAKAFWGKYCPENIEHEVEEWQYHLQQMVLEPEPLKYLEKFL